MLAVDGTAVASSVSCSCATRVASTRHSPLAPQLASDVQLTVGSSRHRLTPMLKQDAPPGQSDVVSHCVLVDEAQYLVRGSVCVRTAREAWWEPTK